MSDSSIAILRGGEILSLLNGREQELLGVVQSAYEAHAAGRSSLPHSTFLRFPEEPGNRIIALPAYLGAPFDIAGVKWVSSFPANLASGLDRASAVVVLNSTQTGRPEAIMEGSVISAKRTAASAALAARALQGGREATRAGLIGCGLINSEVVRFLRAACPEVRGFIVFDLDASRAARFKEKCHEARAGIEVEVTKDIGSVFRNCPLVSIATTAATPHIESLSESIPGSTVLHLSLRDLSPDVILACDNIVDDADHVCRAQTSLHLAEQRTGNRSFIRGTLADVIGQRVPARTDPERVAVFSPFGLGVLDIAVGKFVCDLAREEGRVSFIESFLPGSWLG